MPSLIGLVAPGFAADPAKFADAVAFGRILFPFVAIILVVAAFTGTLNALGATRSRPGRRCCSTSCSSRRCSGVSRRACAGRARPGWCSSGRCRSRASSISPRVALAARFAGYPLRPRWPRLDADLKRLMLFALPGIAVVGSGPVNMLVAAQMSSATPSAVSWLYFADRIFQLPLGFVVAAVGVVLLPGGLAPSRRRRAGGGRGRDEPRARVRAAGALPAAMGLFLFAKPIVGLLYERGAFTAAIPPPWRACSGRSPSGCRPSCW